MPSCWFDDSQHGAAQIKRVQGQRPCPRHPGLDPGRRPLLPSVRRSWHPARRRQGESGKIKSRRNDATDQRPPQIGNRGLPVPSGNGRLGGIAGSDVWPKGDPDRCILIAGRVTQRQRVAGVPAPDFCSVHRMPMRPLAGFEQEVDGGDGGALRPTDAQGFAVPAALRMWREAQRRDQALRLSTIHHRQVRRLYRPPSALWVAWCRRRHPCPPALLRRLPGQADRTWYRARCLP